ncbi:MAG: protein translocase subunit SecF [Bdellovibrionota bacterium]
MFRRIFVPKKTIDFLSHSKVAMFFSTLLLVVSLAVWFARGDDKYGIDYRGGYEIIVKFDDDAVASQDVRDALDEAHFENAVVQAFDNSNEFLLKLSNEEKDTEKIKNLLRDSFNKNIFKGDKKKDSFEILKIDYVGPTAGKELRRQAQIAIAISVIGILIYISVRFEFAFALGAVVALFHDVFIGLGVYLMLGETISMATLAAALTLLGYSVNDTIVIFDRIREKLLAAKDYALEDIINESITEMLVRTVITSILTFFAAFALLVHGGGEIRDLSLFLVIGIIIGCYSTIYVASPVALWYADREAKKASKGKVKVS